MDQLFDEGKNKTMNRNFSIVDLDVDLAPMKHSVCLSQT